MNQNAASSEAETEDVSDTLMTQDELASSCPGPKDPAGTAVTCLLNALADQQPDPFGKAELIVLDVPSDPWAEMVARAIRPVLYGIDNPASSPFSKDPDNRTGVEIYRADDVQPQRLQYQASTEIATDLLTANTIWVVTDNADTRLPPALLAAADRRLVLPDLNQDLYNKFLGEVTGAPPLDHWSPASLAELPPSVLRLAVRQKQGADDYAKRIAKILADKRDTAPAKDGHANGEPPQKLALGDIHGMPDVIEWAQSIATDLQDYKEGRLGWSEVDRGALLYGPPGTGKTTVARAIATYCQVPFFATSYAAWQASGSGHLGDVTRAIRDIFKKARNAAPSILFIDELNSINSRTGKTRHEDWWRAIINTLLEQLDGTDHREGVVVLGATNDPGKIDPAIRRSGRLDRQIRVGFPDIAALKEIYRYCLSNSLPEVDFTRLAAISYGRTGADVERIARGARRRARRSRRDVRFDDVFTELAGRLPSPGDRSLWSVAVHEAAHAIVLSALQPGRLQVVSIFGQGNSAGRTIAGTSGTQQVSSAAIDEELTILMGGRAAEEVILGCCTGGSGGTEDSDLAQATWTAFVAETAYGLGTTGLLWSDPPKMDELDARLASRPKAATAARLRIDRAYERAKSMVTALCPRIEAIAEALLDEFVLTADQVSAILAKCDRNAVGPSIQE